MKKIFTTILTICTACIAAAQSPEIDAKWITLPTDKEFRWMNWEEAPEAVKEATKQVPYGKESNFFAHIKNLLDGFGSPNGGCDVKIALTDLNENGIYGFAISASGSTACCGYAGHGCTYKFIEDGGVLYSELGQAHEVRPGKGKVIASTGKEFPFKSNNKISSQKQNQLKEYFRYR